MKNIDDIKRILKEHKKELKEKYKVKKIAIFGSYARSEENKSSDIDILVEFEEQVSFLFFHLEKYLEKILDLKVDLVTIDAIKPNRAKYILKDLIYV
ncbi:nucleotidyltransferase family protein [bacterium]|nr:nucleotidyltransferase family protein [bacterium]